MKKILLAGATGNLGQHYLKALKQEGYYVRVLVRSAAKAKLLTPVPDDVFTADATQANQLQGSCEGIDVVVSALGKSISLYDRSQASFDAVDYQANLNLLQEAQKAKVGQFIYTSAFGAAAFPHLAYFKAHAAFEEALKASGISYTILAPTALFSAFDEVARMARQGMVGNLGKGDKRTNPIFEGDVARLALQSINQPPQVLPIGGPVVYSRKELTAIACAAAGYKGRVMSVPFAVVKAVLPVLKFVNRSMYHKAAFLVAVCEQDCIAPKVGQHTLEAYFNLAPQTPA